VATAYVPVREILTTMVRSKILAPASQMGPTRKLTVYCARTLHVDMGGLQCAASPIAPAAGTGLVVFEGRG
jgi:hypothetical protein